MHPNNPKNNIEMKTMVMRRVRIVYLARQVLKPFVVESVLLLASAGALISMVSIPSVLANAFHITNFAKVLSYLAEAFVHTQALVQVVSVASLCLALLVAREFLVNRQGAYHTHLSVSAY